eukprot:GEMP01077835.1.p1 GENE.GEMP01077835.1~~GEMP01077835.1.p1  ORF type:complete len:113 (+),score=17.76 GEMP01077835.1:184-522(+)
MAAFLLPFSRALGLDVRYTGGFHFNRQKETDISNEIERHQWLELTLRPSNEVFVTDLTVAKNHKDPWILMPVRDAYSQSGTSALDGLYANGKLIIGTHILPVENSDIDPVLT